jgi:phosphoglycolate phosphatase-like HAD superfamily hydrolase
MTNFIQPQLLIFDLDGLIIDSLDQLSISLVSVVEKILGDDNKIAKFKSYDEVNPGLSRFEKLDYALDLSEVNQKDRQEMRSAYLDEFDKLATLARSKAELDRSIFDFLKLVPLGFQLALLTNCDNKQLDHVLGVHGLESVFVNSAFGTPPSKSSLFPTIVEKLNTNHLPVSSISDSESDKSIAQKNAATFVWIKKFARDFEFDLSSEGLVFETLGDYIQYLTK